MDGKKSATNLALLFGNCEPLSTRLLSKNMQRQAISAFGSGPNMAEPRFVEGADGLPFMHTYPFSCS